MSDTPHIDVIGRSLSWVDVKLNGQTIGPVTQIHYEPRRDHPITLMVKNGALHITSTLTEPWDASIELSALQELLARRRKEVSESDESLRARILAHGDTPELRAEVEAASGESLDFIASLRGVRRCDKSDLESVARQAVADTAAVLKLAWGVRTMSLEEDAAEAGTTLCRLPIEGGFSCIRYTGHQGRCAR